MNPKNKIIIYLFVSLLFVSILPALNFINNPKQFSKDNMFNTDIFESYWNHFFYKYFARSFDNNKVIVGKKDFLFLGNKYNYLVSKTQNIYPKNSKSIGKWVENLHNLQQWYESQGIKFLITVVPNKHTVYSEHLPNWVEIKNELITNELISQSQKSGINIINLRKELISIKDDNEVLYYKRDSHWNSKGAVIGYHYIIDYLNKKYNLDIQAPEYKLIKNNKKGVTMGLSKLLKMTHFTANENEVKYYVNFTKKDEMCKGPINKENQNLLECETGRKGFFSIHRGPQYSVNDQSQNKEKLLLLCDSFAGQNAQLFDRTFNTIWKFHYNKLLNDDLKKFVHEHKPDVVIYQIVERNLYNNDFISRY